VVKHFGILYSHHSWHAPTLPIQPISARKK
jgi:hypothetical protein